MFKTLCIEYKLVSVEYFLDRMQDWEANVLIDCIPFSDRNAWEQIRILSYITAQVNSTKKIKSEDMMSFAWDAKVQNQQRKKEHLTKVITNQDINVLSNMATDIQKKFYQNGGQ